MTRADDLEAIKQLKARYFRLLDTKRWTEWRALFTDDARFEGTSQPFDGPDEFCREVGAWFEQAVTVHHGHMPEISFIGDDAARGVWAMHDYVQFHAPIEAGAYRGMSGFIGFGHYEEEYRCEAGTWKIAFLRLTRLRVDPIAGDAAFPSLPPGLLSGG